MGLIFPEKCNCLARVRELQKHRLSTISRTVSGVLGGQHTERQTLQTFQREKKFSSSVEVAGRGYLIPVLCIYFNQDFSVCLHFKHSFCVSLCGF